MRIAVAGSICFKENKSLQTFHCPSLARLNLSHEKGLHGVLIFNWTERFQCFKCLILRDNSATPTPSLYLHAAVFNYLRKTKMVGYNVFLINLLSADSSVFGTKQNYIQGKQNWEKEHVHTVGETGNYTQTVCMCQANIKSQLLRFTKKSTMTLSRKQLLSVQPLPATNSNFIFLHVLKEVFFTLLLWGGFILHTSLAPRASVIRPQRKIRKEKSLSQIMSSVFLHLSSFSCASKQ